MITKHLQYTLFALIILLQIKTTQAQNALDTITNMSNDNLFSRRLNEKELVKGAGIIARITTLSDVEKKLGTEPSHLKYRVQKGLRQATKDLCLMELAIRFSNDDQTPVTVQQYTDTLARAQHEHVIVQKMYEEHLAIKKQLENKDDHESKEKLEALKVIIDQMLQQNHVVTDEISYLSMMLNVNDQIKEARKLGLIPEKLLIPLEKTIKEEQAKEYAQQGRFNDISWLSVIDRKEHRLVAKNELIPEKPVDQEDSDEEK